MKPIQRNPRNPASIVFMLAVVWSLSQSLMVPQAQAQLASSVSQALATQSDGGISGGGGLFDDNSGDLIRDAANSLADKILRMNPSIFKSFPKSIGQTRFAEIIRSAGNQEHWDYNDETPRRYEIPLTYSYCEANSWKEQFAHCKKTENKGKAFIYPTKNFFISFTMAPLDPLERIKVRNMVEDKLLHEASHLLGIGVQNKEVEERDSKAFVARFRQAMAEDQIACELNLEEFLNLKGTAQLKWLEHQSSESSVTELSDTLKRVANASLGSEPFRLQVSRVTGFGLFGLTEELMSLRSPSGEEGINSVLKKLLGNDLEPGALWFDESRVPSKIKISYGNELENRYLSDVGFIALEGHEGKLLFSSKVSVSVFLEVGFGLYFLKETRNNRKNTPLTFVENELILELNLSSAVPRLKLKGIHRVEPAYADYPLAQVDSVKDCRNVGGAPLEIRDLILAK